MHTDMCFRETGKLLLIHQCCTRLSEDTNQFQESVAIGFASQLNLSPAVPEG